jgi:hypothetical protein
LAVEPSPIWSPIAVASGPLTTSPISRPARSTSMTSVTITCSGRSFQNGRPSGFSQIALDARMNAPM